MNRPGINISMFGVFTTDLTVFVVGKEDYSYDLRNVLECM